MSRTVDYIIGLRDQFSAVAAKVAAEAKKASGSLDGMGNAANKAERALNAIKGGGLSNVAREAERATASIRTLSSAEATQARAREAYANKASIRIAQMRKEREAAEAAAQRAASHRGMMEVAAGSAVGTWVANKVQNVNPFANQAEQDKILRTLQFVGETTAAERIAIRKEVDNMAVKLGLPQLEMLRGMQDLLQAGAEWRDLMAKDNSGRTILENIALAAKGSGEKVSDIASTLIPTIQQFAIEQTKGKLEAYLSTIRTMAIAPQLSPDTTRGHLAGLRQIAGLFNLTNPEGQDPVERLYQASAFQNTLSKLGYANAEAGTALRTLILRMMNPTKRGADELRAAGVDLARITGVDMEKALDGNGLAQSLPKNLKVDRAAVAAVLSRNMREALENGADWFTLKDVANSVLQGSLGKKASKDDKTAAKAAVDRWMRGGGFDPRAFIEEIQKLSAAAFFNVAGTYRTPQAAALAGKGAIDAYDKALEAIRTRGPQALDVIANIKLDESSFDLATQRVSASWQKLMNSMQDSGPLAKIAAGLNSLANVMDRLAGGGKNPVADGLKAPPEQQAQWLRSLLGDPHNGRAVSFMRWGPMPYLFPSFPAAVPSMDPAAIERWARDSTTAAPGAGRFAAGGLGGEQRAQHSLPAAAAEAQITVRSHVDVTAPQTVTLTGNLTVSGPGISGGGQVNGSLPLSTNAPRGQTTATEVPGPAVQK